jgi:hypothetical protein
LKHAVEDKNRLRHTSENDYQLLIFNPDQKYFDRDFLLVMEANKILLP